MKRAERRAQRQTVSSKLLKSKLLLRGGDKLARHVPPAAELTSSRLRAMLRRYGMVYVKPDTGSMGVGVCRVERSANGGWSYRHGQARHRFATYAGMYRALRRQTGDRRYLVQKGIHTLRHKGRPLDFRVMVQRNPAGKWERTGIAARVAHPAKIVSNGSQGGTIYDARQLLSSLAGAGRAPRLLARMDDLALRTAAKLGAAYPAMRELGIDIAVDRRLLPWILEVNTRPDPCPFVKLADRTAIRKIVRYARAYGRRYCLKCGKAKQGTV